MLIDIDIHVGYESLHDLDPYFDAATRELVRSSGSGGLRMPTYPWNHPTGWDRKDVTTWSAPSGSIFANLTPEQVREQHLDPYDVTIGILSPDEAAAFSVFPNARLAAPLCRAYNDYLLDHWVASDPRLRALLIVPAQHPVEAAAEVRRLGGRDEFVGVFLPGGARTPYGNPVYDPFWEAVSEHELPVVVHTHFEGIGIAGPVTAAGYPDFYVEYHTLCGSGMYGHFVSILCHGVFERFPGAKLVMVEGGLVPFVGFLWRLDTNWKACRSEIPWCRRRPSEYVWEHVRFASQPLESPDEEELLLPALAGLRPSETLLFASDYPHWDFDEPTQTLRQLPAEWRENVAWRNAASFFRLPVAATA